MVPRVINCIPIHSHSLSHTHTHTHTQTHAHTHSHTHTLEETVRLVLWVARPYTHSLSLTHPQTHTHICTHTHRGGDSKTDAPRVRSWRRLIGSPKLQIIFHKRATKYRSLLRKMTYKDNGSYESSPPCRSCSRKYTSLTRTHTHTHTRTHTGEETVRLMHLRVMRCTPTLSLTHTQIHTHTLTHSLSLTHGKGD